MNYSTFKKFYFFSVFVIILSASYPAFAKVLPFGQAKASESAQNKKSLRPPTKADPLTEYLEFFQKVYDKMQENYYQPLSQETYDTFIQKFKEKIYPQLKGSGKSEDFVRWRSAAYMVEDLKAQEDIFSAFYPPKPAKEYQESALGVKQDIGIEGELRDGKFVVTLVEPRSDAYVKGLAVNDVLLKVGGKDLKGMPIEKINELLIPDLNSTTEIVYFSEKENIEKSINVLSQEYFKQTVFLKPVKIPGIFCLEVRRFNQKTGEDLLRFLEYIRSKETIHGLILDLRNNPGGPPLAARELAAFFLDPGSELAYFQKKGQPKAMLDVPNLPKKYHYDGPIVILVDDKSGSSSELFSGVMQRLKRATIMGRNTAGQVMLKSMFDFDDGSMVLLVTARGHFPDGGTFSFHGVTPDRYVKEDETEDLVEYAAKYLVYITHRLPQQSIVQSQ